MKDLRDQKVLTIHDVHPFISERNGFVYSVLVSDIQPLWFHIRFEYSVLVSNIQPLWFRIFRNMLPHGRPRRSARLSSWYRGTSLIRNHPLPRTTIGP